MAGRSAAEDPYTEVLAEERIAGGEMTLSEIVTWIDSWTEASV